MMWALAFIFVLLSPVVLVALLGIASLTFLVGVVVFFEILDDDEVVR